MFFILAVILIAIAGILFMLIFDDKSKMVSEQKVDNRAIPFNQDSSASDEVKIVFDEPVDVKNINFSIDVLLNQTKTNSDDPEQKLESKSSGTNNALTTNSKINPFNF